MDAPPKEIKRNSAIKETREAAAKDMAHRKEVVHKNEVALEEPQRNPTPDNLEIDAINTSPATKPKTAPSKSQTQVNWNEMIKSMGITGLVKILAQNCVLDSWDLPKVKLSLSKQQAPLLSERQHAKLKEALQKHLSIASIDLNIHVAGSVDVQKTPAKQEEIKKQEQVKGVSKKLQEDEGFKKILARGGALDRFEIVETENK